MAKKAKKAKKTAKKAKKADMRGKWSRKPIVSLQFLNADKIQKGGTYTKISKSGVYFSPDDGKTMELTSKSFVLFARDGERYFVAKKPAGLFGGHKLQENRVAKRKKGIGGRLWVGILASKLKFPMGYYTLGKPVRTSLPDHKNKEVRFEAFELIPL